MRGLVSRCVQLLDETGRVGRVLHALVQLGSDLGQRCEVHLAPVAQKAPRDRRRVRLQVVADDQLGVRLEQPGHDPRPAEGVENPNLPLAQPFLDGLDRVGNLSKQGALVPDVRDELALEILRILILGVVWPKHQLAAVTG